MKLRVFMRNNFEIKTFFVLRRRCRRKIAILRANKSYQKNKNKKWDEVLKGLCLDKEKTMKKKGLIISTVVMVVVLIASLTTATYAWFSVNPEAKINDVIIETQASTGLEIAAYHIGADGINLYSGDVSLQGAEDAARYWGATDAGDYGSEIRMTTGDSADTTLIKNIYATSGNGVNMFVNSDELQNLAASGKPVSLVSAVENKNYFALDFTLRASSNGTIFIKELQVTPTGTNAKMNMAGSLRVALFSTTPSATAITEAPTWDPATNGVFCYDPYASRCYKGGSFATDTTPGKIYALQAGDYTAEGVMSTQTLDAIWGADKYIKGNNGFETSGAIRPAGGTYSNLQAAEAAHSKYKLSAIETGQMVYLRLVIWFDGEDEACITAFAGGGAQVKVNFGLEAPAAIGG